MVPAKLATAGYGAIARDALARTATEIATAVARAEGAWREYMEQPAGRVTLRTFPTGGEMLLPGLITRMAERPDVELAMNRRQQHSRHARAEVVPRDDVARELVVGAVLDHELQLVTTRSWAKTTSVRHRMETAGSAIGLQGNPAAREGERTSGLGHQSPHRPVTPRGS